jgi:hypothetical protein
MSISVVMPTIAIAEPMTSAASAAAADTKQHREIQTHDQ